MRQRNSAARRRLEYAAATVIVCPPITTILDGIIRGRFSCQVHPVGGGEVKTFDVWAFFSWEAANIAIERYKEAAR